MTRYYFHVRDNAGDLCRDNEGQELPDLAAARQEALNASRELLGEQLLHGGQIAPQQIEIAGERGDVLLTVDVRATLFQQDHLRLFRDDVTQSAPKAH
jgi:hypothetical protein